MAGRSTYPCSRSWDKGEVIHLDMALIVPFADLTEGDIIAEAITRFRP